MRLHCLVLFLRSYRFLQLGSTTMIDILTMYTMTTQSSSSSPYLCTLLLHYLLVLSMMIATPNMRTARTHFSSSDRSQLSPTLLLLSMYTTTDTPIMPTVLTPSSSMLLFLSMRNLNGQPLLLRRLRSLLYLTMECSQLLITSILLLSYKLLTSMTSPKNIARSFTTSITNPTTLVLIGL